MNKIALIPSEADQRKIGSQMRELDRAGSLGMMNWIALGDLVTQVREGIGSARGTVATGGVVAKGTGIKGWLETYTEGEVSESKAYRYEQLAEGIRAELKIGKRINLAQVITGASKEPAAKALLDKVANFVAGKSQRTLLIGIGKPDAQRGGARKSGKEPTPEEQREAWLVDARNRAVTVFSGMDELKDRWQVLSDDELRLAVDNAQAFAKKAAKWLATPKPLRPALNVEQRLKEAQS